MIILYIIRALEIDHIDGEWRYHRMETRERFGPIPSFPSMLEHIHDKLFEQIADELHCKQYLPRLTRGFSLVVYVSYELRTGKRG
jgi:hypothetical protein